MTTLTLNEALNQITPASESAIAQAWGHWDAIAMPLRSLGIQSSCQDPGIYQGISSGGARCQF